MNIAVRRVEVLLNAASRLRYSANKAEKYKLCSMDSERRGSDNHALPLVSISSKVDAAKHASSQNANSLAGETATTMTKADESVAVGQTADSQMPSHRHANGEREREVASVQGAAGDSAYPGVSESEVTTRRPNAAGVRLSKQVSIAASTPTEPPVGVPQRPERDSVLMRERDTSLSRSVLNESTVAGSAASTVRRRSRIGHRRVDEAGTVTYKRTPTGQLMRAIQMGIDHSIKTVASKPERDILISDFRTLELVEFPSRGTHITPPHEYNDFTFKTYAPYAFRFFRALFGIKSDQFIDSLTGSALIELSNPGASGSIFYLSPDYDFIIKTVQKKEAHFLQKLLPGYYLNLNQNPRTLLPKFYGLYCYCSLGKKIRFVVMNNLLPTVTLHEKYDLKGSTFKREASEAERSKASPTLKDLDFQRIHPSGLEFDSDSYQTLLKTLQRDCRVLESFRIMDYSLLLGIHNLDRAKQEQAAGDCNANACTSSGTSDSCDNEIHKEPQNAAGTSRSRTVYSTASQMIDASRRQTTVDADGDGNDQDAVDSLQIGLSRAGIPARNANGEKLLVYAGIIDILQYYRLAKRLEHAWKSVVTDGNTVSVHHPSFYSNRFLKFFENSAFKKGQPQRASGPSARIRKLQCVMRLAIKKISHVTPVKVAVDPCLREKATDDESQVQSSDQQARTSSVAMQAVAEAGACSLHGADAADADASC